MPKVDITAALKTDDTETKNRRNMARKATSSLLGGFSLSEDFASPSKLQVQSVPFEKIREREVNEFSLEADIITLAESIRLCGLINPLSVVHHTDEDIYVISSGHRRYKAIEKLRELYPDDRMYDNVDCAVYEVTEDPFQLKQGLPYISKDQEEQIYRDSNLETRQLSYEDVARQIRYIVTRFEDPDYFQKCRDNLEEKGIKTYTAHTDRVKVITSVLGTQNYAGWGRESIRKYLIIIDADRNDLLDQIEKGESKLDRAYKTVVADEKKSRNRKTNKITALRAAVNDFAKEAEKREYSASDIEEIRHYIEVLTDIVNNNSSQLPPRRT